MCIIYIYVCVCIYIYIYIYNLTFCDYGLILGVKMHSFFFFLKDPFYCSIIDIMCTVLLV